MILINEILDSAPPPAYPGRGAGDKAAMSSAEDRNAKLPAVLWLKVLGFLALTGDQETKAAGRGVLHREMRFVCRNMYIASMSLLRTHYLPAYIRQVCPPFTTDPWPASSSSSSFSPKYASCRETRVLDLYVAAETKRDSEHFESELLEQPGMGNLFDLHQPRARLEDLIAQRGTMSGHLVERVTQTGESRVRAQDVSINFGLRKAELRLPMATSSNTTGGDRGRPLPRRTLLEVERTRTASLEETADALLHELACIPLRAVVAPSESGDDGLLSVSYVEDASSAHQRGLAPLPPQQRQPQEQQASSAEADKAGKGPLSRSRVSNWFKKVSSTGS